MKSMTDDKPKIIKFRGPGRGIGGSGTPKGRQLTPESVSEVAELLGDMPRTRDLLIEALHLIQDRYKCLHPNHLVALAEEFRLALSEIYETATFYHHFDILEDDQGPPPEITIRVCNSLTCEMAGAKSLISNLKSTLGEDVRILTAPCMGACDRAPAVAVAQNQVFHATPKKIQSAVSNGQLKPIIPNYIDVLFCKKSFLQNFFCS